jgi:hypothetical protein
MASAAGCMPRGLRRISPFVSSDFSYKTPPLPSTQTLATASDVLTVDFRQPSHEFTFNVGIDLLL